MKLSRIIKTIFILVLLFTVSVNADEITDKITFIGVDTNTVTDSKLSTHAEVNELTLKSNEEIFGIFIEYNEIPNGGYIGEQKIAENGFLHEYIELNGTTDVTLLYEYADICNIRVFGKGEIPSDVERWEKAPDGVDLLLLATHSDDDQLFFAGLLPTYASHPFARVAVAYFINHYDTYNRTHELLRGLWHCGVRYYPEISPFPDDYSESVEGAKNYLSSQGITDEDIENYHKLLLDKYKPQVVVLHDFKGEYGHGAHMLATRSFLDVLEKTHESSVKKVYVHLYEENPLVLDIDTGLSDFDGKSAFQVSQEAFKYHESQHWTWFYSWIYGKNNDITESSQIRSYNPSLYGLYYSTVGNDTGANNMLENIVPYVEQEAQFDTPVPPLIKDESTPQVAPVIEQQNDSVFQTNIPLFVIISGILVFSIIIVLLLRRTKK